MKKLTILSALAVALMSAAVAQEQTSTVYSANIVGFIKVDVPAGLSLVSSPFKTSEGKDPTINDVFGAGTPQGTELLIYSAKGYATYTYYADAAAWFDEKDNEANPALPLGTGFWVRAFEPFTFYLKGDVPTAATTPVTIVSGLQLISHAYPTDRNIKDMNITPAQGDEIYCWSGTGYSIYTYYKDTDAWYDTDDNPVTLTLKAGQAYWYLSRNKSSYTWDQPRPY